MSLSWRNRIQIFLAPDRVDLTGIARGIRPVQQFRQSGVCVQEDDSRQQWKAPLQLLEQMLAQVDGDFRRGAELHVVLSNHFVRYGVIAPQPSLANPDELMAYAGFQMREIYGERIDDWELSLSAWDPCGGAWCAAIARDLQSGLEALVRRLEIRLVRTEPYLAAAFDHGSKQLTGKQIWFVLVETGRFCLVSQREGIWCCVRNQRIVKHLQEELLSALELESIASGLAEAAGPVYVFAPGFTGLLPESVLRWQFICLSKEEFPIPVHFPGESGDRRDHA